MPEEPTGAFTSRLAGGNEAAWSEFFDRYYPRIRAYVTVAWIGEQEAVDDLVQETLIRAARYIRCFDEETALWDWIARLARSAMADRGKAQRRRGNFLQRFRDFIRIPEARPTEGVDEMLSHVDSESAHLLRGKYLEGKTVADLALELGASEKAIESRLTRARSHLRRVVKRR